MSRTGRTIPKLLAQQQQEKKQERTEPPQPKKSTVPPLYTYSAIAKTNVKKIKIEDPQVLELERTCDKCKQDKKYIEFPTVAGKTVSDPIEERYSTKCLSCSQKEVMVSILENMIDKEQLSDAEKKHLKNKAANLILVKGYDILTTKKELGLQDKLLIFKQNLK